MYLLGCKERNKVLPKHIRIKKVCGSVVGVNYLNIMCTLGKYLKFLQKDLHCNPKNCTRTFQAKKITINYCNSIKQCSGHSLIYNTATLRYIGSIDK